ncbi:hypothetical protein DASB73_022550 [Starmerella bacillaris]|uniref:N-acetyltransferase domain-containing protein n=1 Tax=Starmerella bacillaris TaxID=1247836 RepID=A0AAV5RJQ5_STABA|nr:hypothetical protein DASB73_022550 [Starmerella bacillaris]
MTTWEVKTGNSLSAKEIYEILQMRNGVFTFEQSCVEQDADDLDLLSDTYHIIGTVPEEEKPVAYARLVYTKDEPEEVRLGRLLVVKDYRKKHLGKEVLEKSLEIIEEKKKQYNTKIIVAHSQFYLREWYARYGFEIDGEAFEEGRIMHVKMVKKI